MIYAWILRSNKDVLLFEFDNVHIINSHTVLYAVAYKDGRKMAANTGLSTYVILMEANLSSTKPPSLQFMVSRMFV